MTVPPNGGRVPSQRTAIESIEEATVEARTGGHTLGGFVRRCNSAGYGFFARCRVCRIEVAVHRTAAGWNHSLEAPACQADPGGTRTPSRNGQNGHNGYTGHGG
ncbi:MAG: hypothetical protein JWM18_1193 [Chloroflexi bacterium]|jgi:hypothetical protein|nr:hypothetical protein [Chloroflexota bacterium]